MSSRVHCSLLEAKGSIQYTLMLQKFLLILFAFGWSWVALFLTLWTSEAYRAGVSRYLYLFYWTPSIIAVVFLFAPQSRKTVGVSIVTIIFAAMYIKPIWENYRYREDKKKIDYYVSLFPESMRPKMSDEPLVRVEKSSSNELFVIVAFSNQDSILRADDIDKKLTHLLLLIERNGVKTFFDSTPLQNTSIWSSAQMSNVGSYGYSMSTTLPSEDDDLDRRVLETSHIALLYKNKILALQLDPKNLPNLDIYYGKNKFTAHWNQLSDEIKKISH